MMLKTALVAMTIVGCDCNAKLCEFVSESPTQYATVAECKAAVNASAMRTPSLNYPLVTGICRSVAQVSDQPPVTELASLEETDGHSLYDMFRQSGGLVRETALGGISLAKAGATWTVERVKPTVFAVLPRI
jgi:hypothetical protein